jgi:hypothetical protein
MLHWTINLSFSADLALKIAGHNFSFNTKPFRCQASNPKRSPILNLELLDGNFGAAGIEAIDKDDIAFVGAVGSIVEFVGIGDESTGSAQ